MIIPIAILKNRKKYLENIRNKFEEIDIEKDFIIVTIFSPLYPEIMTDLICETKNIYGLESRMAEYAISGFGFDRMYKDIATYNIIWLTELAKKIKRTFSSQKVINIKSPFLNIQKIKEFPRIRREVFVTLCCHASNKGWRFTMENRVAAYCQDMSRMYCPNWKHKYAIIINKGDIKQIIDDTTKVLKILLDNNIEIDKDNICPSYCGIPIRNMNDVEKVIEYKR